MRLGLSPRDRSWLPRFPCALLLCAVLVLGTGGIALAQASPEPAGAAAPTAPAAPAAVAPEDRLIFYINLDAFGYDLYELANQPPYPGTPNLNALLEEGVLFTNATSGFPSITAPMQTSLVTGAWPSATGNYYRGYDKEAGILRQTERENAAQTLAEVFAEAGLPTASLQQFTLLHRGTSWDDPRHLYLEPGGGFGQRVDVALELLSGRPVESRRDWVVMPELPRFLALYSDDLDALGHNEKAAFDLPVAADEARRVDRVIKKLTGGHPGLEGIDEALGRLVAGLRELGLYDRTVFALASDHGMTGLSGPSSLPDLLATLAGLGYRVQLLSPGESPFPDTQVVVWTVGLQAQLAFLSPLMPDEYQSLVAALASREYYGGHLGPEDLERLGAHPFSGDLVLWPKPPHHFKADVFRAYPARGQHDTLDPSSRHIFLALAGPGVRRGLRIDTPVQAIDLAPTLARLAGLPPPAQAQGRVLAEALTEEGPASQGEAEKGTAQAGGSQEEVAPESQAAEPGGIQWEEKAAEASEAVMENNREMEKEATMDGAAQDTDSR